MPAGFPIDSQLHVTEATPADIPSHHLDLDNWLFCSLL
jgi:hypothetical protein